MSSIDGYQTLRTIGGAVKRTDRGVLAVTGRDRAAWLQGLVTNDVTALADGQQCYAAYLTPQGRMITDVNILALGSRLLLDVPAPLASSLRDRLDGLIFSEDAQVADETAQLAVWTVFGTPAAEGSTPEVVITEVGETPMSTMPSRFPGLAEVDFDAFEIVRVEDGVPRFLVDMTEDTIPLEAGIEDRAISFTKGCYVGQEVIVRVTHRGGGRVARKLVRWQAAALGTSVPTGDSRILSGDRDIGRVTSAVIPPGQHAMVGLGYVHRDFADRGTEVSLVWNDARTPARVG